MNPVFGTPLNPLPGGLLLINLFPSVPCEWLGGDLPPMNFTTFLLQSQNPALYKD